MAILILVWLSFSATIFGIINIGPLTALKIVPNAVINDMNVGFNMTLHDGCDETVFPFAKVMTIIMTKPMKANPAPVREGKE